MSEDSKQTKQLPPLVSSTVIALAVYALRAYQTGELLRPIVGAILGGCGGYLIIWIGTQRSRRQSCASSSAKGNKEASDACSSRIASLHLAMIAALIAVIAVPIGLMIRDKSKRASAPAAEEKRLADKAIDDAEVRRRRFLMHFWKDFSGSEDRVRENVEAKIEDGTIAIESFKLNAPSGPAEVTYHGTASDAMHIQQTIRWTGVPSTGWMFVDLAAD